MVGNIITKKSDQLDTLIQYEYIPLMVVGEKAIARISRFWTGICDIAPYKSELSSLQNNTNYTKLPKEAEEIQKFLLNILGDFIFEIPFKSSFKLYSDTCYDCFKLYSPIQNLISVTPPDPLPEGVKLVNYSNELRFNVLDTHYKANGLYIPIKFVKS